MSFGLRVWDESGILTLDTDTLGGRVVASADASASSGVISAPGLSNGTPFAFISSTVATVLSGYSYEARLPSPFTPDLTLTGSGFSWVKPPPKAQESGVTSVIYAGVF